ncbi:hypothetical protein BOX15_Mlig032748g1 [Macrostomum lignano]|uniref:Uncharacterized protein n=1 Tax=Macrostomum lignano TaxID=282301 RepID=A0A267ERK4_9PLAT|nr:hypothetical protein BOX15_Mlig032748g1 [Macrostomum lignano]
MLRECTVDILVVLLMKMCSKVVDNQFGTLSPGKFLSVNGTCRLSDQCFDSRGSAVSWIYSTRYLLPVLGGLLANACMGYLVVIHICGHLMLLSSILLMVEIFFDFICSSSALVTAAWSPIPILYGLIQPCIVYCIYRWYPQPRIWTILSVAYFLSVKLGEFIGIVLPMSEGLVGNYYTLVGIVASIAFIAMSRYINTDDLVRRDRFTFPTTGRLIRYFKIFSPMIPFIISVARSQSLVYTIEMRHYIESIGSTNTTNGQSNECLVSPELMKVSCQIVWSLLLMLVAYRSSKHISIELRLQGGIIVKALVEIVLILVSRSPPQRTLSVQAVFWAASAVDGAAELLTVIAAFEILNGVAPNHCKLFVMGIGFTVWGLATLAGQSLVAILSAVPAHNPVLQPAQGRAPLFYVYHMIIVAFLIVSSAYYRFVAYPMAVMLFLSGDISDQEDCIDDEQWDREINEETPLIEFTA